MALSGVCVFFCVLLGGKMNHLICRTASEKSIGRRFSGGRIGDDVVEYDMTVCLDKSFVHVSVRYRAAEWSVEARRRCFAATALASYGVPGTKYLFLMGGCRTGLAARAACCIIHILGVILLVSASSSCTCWRCGVDVKNGPFFFQART